MPPTTGTKGSWLVGVFFCIFMTQETWCPGTWESRTWRSPLCCQVSVGVAPPDRKTGPALCPDSPSLHPPHPGLATPPATRPPPALRLPPGPPRQAVTQ